MRLHRHVWKPEDWVGENAVAKRCHKCGRVEVWGWDDAHFYYGTKVVDRR